MVAFRLTCAAPGLSLIAVGPALGAPHGGQLWTPAVTLPHGRDGRRVRRMAVLCTCSMPSICLHVHHQFLRNVLHDVTTNTPITVYHQGSYVETYSSSVAERLT